MTTAAVERETGWIADASTFGARLALIRQRMGWGNVDKAATACGIKVETWRSWERDGREPHRLTLVAKQIAGTTGCDYRWLVHGPDRGEGGLTTGYSVKPISERLVTTVGEPRRVPTVRRPQQRRHPTGLRPVTPLAA